jgi:hypothetical protein
MEELSEENSELFESHSNEEYPDGYRDETDNGFGIIYDDFPKG